ncbi:16S rRNA (uracil(1498)-N(3))-methyltransferase [Roseateles sp. BYS180W]|uniref:Ribosomal RNA small subunit methyltransferase E n=1 Tax=Roseateles rivi TaxID=3299028 RepID=A0ABW7FTP9_9BURK
MPARIFVDTPLHADSAEISLPAAAARHVQVLRLQPGHSVLVFDGRGGEWQAEVTHMGRSEVRVRLLARHVVQRELSHGVHLAVVMPANDRMDGLVEKATELGAASIQPLMAERSVLRLSGERAQKKCAHWLGVAVAAAEQCGRTQLPLVHPVQNLASWLAQLSPDSSQRRWLLSPGAQQTLATALPQPGTTTLVLSGPEGGLSPAEEAAALARGFTALALGPRILRADTAPLAVLGTLSLLGADGV